jgi:hypothetical protein
MAKKKKGPTPKRQVQHPNRRDARGLSARFLVAAFALGAIVVLGAVFVLARNDDPTNSARGDDAGPIHVHGLGINPSGGSLLIATHTGTYRLAPNERKATRIGDSRQDTMGFTVAGPDHFLGSGHPDVEEAVEEDLPPHLGLIESKDAGRTWRPVALLGEADFHVLRFANRHVYGYDASNDRLLVSRDAGRTWRETSRPAPVLDLVVDPADAERLVAAAEGGLYESTNEGRTWRRVVRRIGLLAWPVTERLYLVDFEGSMSVSAAGGTRWTRLGNVGGQPAALLAHSVEELYVALHDGTIKQSRDGGRTWSVRSTP